MVPLVVVISGCKKTDINKTGYDGILKNNIRLVPESVARAVAEQFNPSLFLRGAQSDPNLSGVKSDPVKVNGGAKVNGKLGSTLPIKDRVILHDREGIPALYIFNYEKNNGYLVVSADSGMRPVLAYIEKGEYANGKAPGGAVMWLNKTMFNLEVIRKGLYDNKKLAKIAWIDYFATMNNGTDKLKKITNGIVSNFVNPPPPDDPCIADPNYVSSTSSSIGPLLPVQWGQMDTYNDLLANRVAVQLSMAPHQRVVWQQLWPK